MTHSLMSKAGSLTGRLLAAACGLLLSFGVHAQTPQQEAAIRKNLNDRLPGIPKIDEIARTPLAGIFEVRMGQDIIYTDSDGSVILQGQMIDTRTRKNLTEERLDKLTAVAFDSLPLDDAFTIVRGNGKRKLAVFEDPNCGYCKRFERDMQKVNDVTVYLFLMPILGADSTEKSRHIWCAKDRAKAWADMMVNDKTVPRPMGACDSAALARNVEFGRKHRITGTPTLIFANGKRVPGAVAAAEVEKLLAEAR
jgi:thiol:disulfide interchange protein DsbC